MKIDYNAGEDVIDVRKGDWAEASHKIGVLPWKDGVIRLIAIEPQRNKVMGSEFFITESLPMARGFIHAFEYNSTDALDDIVIYVQDYESYEDACLVALQMQEEKENCYYKLNQDDE